MKNETMKKILIINLIVSVVLLILVCVLFSYVRVDREFEGRRCDFGEFAGSSSRKIRGITDIPGEMVRVYYYEYHDGEYYVADVKEDELWIYVEEKGYCRYSEIE